jgi:hypothetical protein
MTKAVIELSEALFQQHENDSVVFPYIDFTILYFLESISQVFFTEA